MENPWQARRDRAMRSMFVTRSDAWAAVGLDINIDRGSIRRARGRLILTLSALIATIVAKSWALRRWNDSGTKVPFYNSHGKLLGDRVVGAHHFIFNTKAPFEIVAVLIVLALGWLISKDLSRLAPTLFKRMDPATAGTVGFIVRLVSVVATLLGAINIAGVSAQVVAVGGAFTAVVVGLAAQPVLGNLFAGMVLLSAQPFHLGDRVRLYAGAIGTQEGTVASLGLLYTSLARGASRVMIPNSLVLAAVVVPLREPTPVDVRVKLNRGVKPSHAQAILDNELGEETLGTPNVVLEEINGDNVFIRVQATPETNEDSSRLADQIIKVLASVTGEHATLDAGAGVRADGKQTGGRRG